MLATLPRIDARRLASECQRTCTEWLFHVIWVKQTLTGLVVNGLLRYILDKQSVLYEHIKQKPFPEHVS